MKYINIKSGTTYSEEQVERLGLLASPDVYKLIKVEPLLEVGKVAVYSDEYVIEGKSALYMPTLRDATLEEAKKQAKKLIHPQEVREVSVEGITFNGGDGSAAAISGAVSLAQQLGESTVDLWDINNVVHKGLPFEFALTVAATVAKEYRDSKIVYYEKLSLLEACTTVAEILVILEGE